MRTPTTLVVLTLTTLLTPSSSQWLQSCDSPIYCQGDLLDTIQMAQIHQDSKEFVDMKQRNPTETTLANFATFQNTHQNPTKDQIRQFVNDNFDEGDEFEDWLPTDYTPTPKLLNQITNDEVKEFVGNLVGIWPNLARKVKQEVWDSPDQYSLIPVKEGFIIPGGRFKEFYYWDSYWIIKGLILSDMKDTVMGILDNFVSLVDRFGFIPNGARVYYLNRSQPPLLTLMAQTYITASGNYEWLEKNIDSLEKELNYWLENRKVTININNNTYTAFHYNSSSGTPRPESYLEDVNTALFFPNPNDKNRLYANLKSGAESGHDFSSRWLVDEQGGNNANLTFIQTPRIIPVDLNSFLCQAFWILSDFYRIIGIGAKWRLWNERSLNLRKTINELHYHEQDGIWYDWDLELGNHRRYFYASNFAPLWADAYDPTVGEELGKRALSYLTAQGILDFMGGVPTSLMDNGQQWDFPNAWPPLQAFVILGLKKTGHEGAIEVAEKLAKRWIQANMIGFNETGAMFEKYNATEPGEYGGGGEYEVQSGFGWTNGVVLELIDLYYGEN